MFCRGLSLYRTGLATSLDHHRSKIVLLRSSLREIQHGIVKLGDNHFRFALAELFYDCTNPLGSKLFSSAILPFKKAIRNQEHAIAGFHADLFRYRFP